MPIPYRKHQKEDTDTLRDVVRSILPEPIKRILFIASVSYGKSVVIYNIAEAYSNAGKVVWILSNRTSVIKQLNERAGHLKNIRVMTVQAADSKKNREILPEEPADLILVDEIHMGGAAPQYQRVMNYSPGALVVAFTGTPKPELFDIFPKFVQGKTSRWLYENGFISDIKYVCVPPDKLIDLKKVKVVKGEYDSTQLIDELDKKKIYSDVIQEYKKYCMKKPTIGFCINVKHAEDLQKQFISAGIECEVLTGKDRKKEEERKIEFLKKGGLVLSVEKITTGFDLPDLFAILIIRPTNSLSLWIQILGRLARLSEAYKIKYVLDFVGNTLNHGTLLTEHDWKNLEKEEKQQKTENGDTLKVRQCTECFAVVESIYKECPYCNTTFAKEKRIPINESVRLRELDEAEIEKQRIAIREARKRMKGSIKQNTAFLSKKMPFLKAKDKAIENKRKKYEETFKYDDPILRSLIEEDFKKNNIQL